VAGVGTVGPDAADAVGVKVVPVQVPYASGCGDRTEAASW